MDIYVSTINKRSKMLLALSQLLEVEALSDGGKALHHI